MQVFVSNQRLNTFCTFAHLVAHFQRFRDHNINFWVIFSPVLCKKSQKLHFLNFDQKFWIKFFFSKEMSNFCKIMDFSKFCLVVMKKVSKKSGNHDQLPIDLVDFGNFLYNVNGFVQIYIRIMNVFFSIFDKWQNHIFRHLISSILT